MKKYPIEELTFEKLYKAYINCKKHKSNTFQAMDFEFEREKNLSQLYYDIVNDEYEIGTSIVFIVTEPKYREVWAGSFRDRIVHHLIYNAIYERFTKKFIYDSYSCIVGKGTLAAINRARKFACNVSQHYTKKAYYLKMDIKNYFVSIDKNILYKEIIGCIDEKEELWLKRLIEKVVFHDPRTNYIMQSDQKLRSKLPTHKSLFNAKENKGLPIGNLTSQFFSNVYLNGLDQYAKRILGCKHYIRYVDDIIIMGEDPVFLNYAYSKINRYLIDNLDLELNHRKKNMNLLSQGFDLLGHVIKPTYSHLRYHTKMKCLNEIEAFKKKGDKVTCEDVLKLQGFVNSYVGMLSHVDGIMFKKKILNKLNVIFEQVDCLKLA